MKEEIVEKVVDVAMDLLQEFVRGEKQQTVSKIRDLTAKNPDYGLAVLACLLQHMPEHLRKILRSMLMNGACD
jgi:hypothetical protein